MNEAKLALDEQLVEAKLGSNEAKLGYVKELSTIKGENEQL